MSNMTANNAETYPHRQPNFFRVSNLGAAEYIPRMEEHPQLSDFQLRLRMAMAQKKLSANALSVRADLNRETVGKLLKPGAGLPRGSTIKALADALGISQGELLGDQPTTEPHEPHTIGLTYDSADEEVEIKAIVAGSYGDGAFQMFDNSLGRTTLPRGLRRYTNVYAIIIVNDSMSPEHKPGEQRFVTPDAKPLIGDSVVIEFERDPDRGPEAMIGHLLQNGSTIKIGKLNPPGIVEIDSRHKRKLHRIAPQAEVL